MVERGKMVYRAEMLFRGGGVKSLEYRTERGLQRWIRRTIDARGVRPHRVVVEHYRCVQVDVVVRRGN